MQPKQQTKPRLPAVITADEQAKHDDSKKRYPELRLSPGEYVLEVVHRNPIGIVSIWAITGFLILVALGLVPLYAMGQGFLAQIFMTTTDKLPSPETFALPAVLLAALFTLGGFVASVVYNGNRFYLTNESIIQFVQYSLFNTKQQVLNLINVEDASSTQTGILEQVLNYGTLRLSTQGQETIYNFRFTSNPKKVVNNINDAAEVAVRKLEGNYPPTEF